MGKKYVELDVNNKNTKAEKLSLRHPCFVKTAGIHRVHEDEDDPFCYVRLFEHYNNNLLPHPDSGIDIGCNDRFFRREAPEKQLRQRRKLKQTFRAGLTSHNVCGKGYFNGMMKEIAERAQLDNIERQYAASLRPESISACYNADNPVDSSVVCAFSRHKPGSSAHEVYKRANQSQLDKKTEAMRQERYRTFRDPQVCSITLFY